MLYLCYYCAENECIYHTTCVMPEIESPEEARERPAPEDHQMAKSVNPCQVKFNMWAVTPLDFYMYVRIRSCEDAKIAVAHSAVSGGIIIILIIITPSHSITLTHSLTHFHSLTHSLNHPHSLNSLTHSSPSLTHSPQSLTHSLSPMARPFWTYHTFDLDLIFKVKTGIEILLCQFWSVARFDISALTWETSNHACRYLWSISPWSHKMRSLWPLTWDLWPKFTSPMLTQWGTECWLYCYIVYTDKPVFRCQNITHDRLSWTYQCIWPWTLHFQGQTFHGLKFDLSIYQTWHNETIQMTLFQGHIISTMYKMVYRRLIWAR